MIPDPKSPEQAKQERRVPLAQNDNRFRPLLAGSMFDGNGWYFQPSYLGEDMIDYEEDLL